MPLVEPSKKADPLASAVQAIEEVSTLPHIAVRIMQVANDPSSGASDLKRVMESDVALSARVLRFVNSSACGLRAKVTHLQQAITYLGLKQIRNIALTASVSQLFHDTRPIGCYSRAGLWKHLVSVAIGARLIARRLQLPNAEDAFLAGLLHDLGLIFEDQHMHATFVLLIEGLTNDRFLVQAERELFGFDHTLLGEKVARQWSFPEVITTAIRHHHAPLNYQGEHIRVVRCVELANVLCSAKGITSVGVNRVKLSQSTLTALSLDREQLPDLVAAMDAELAQSGSLAQL